MWCRSLKNDQTDASCNCEAARKEIELNLQRMAMMSENEKLIAELEAEARDHHVGSQVLTARLLDKAATALREQAEKLKEANSEIYTLNERTRDLDQFEKHIETLTAQLAAEKVRVGKAELCIYNMWTVDKTSQYEYSRGRGKNTNRFGDYPQGIGERWKTPRELAEGYYGQGGQELWRLRDIEIAALKEQA